MNPLKIPAQTLVQNKFIPNHFSAGGEFLLTVIATLVLLAVPSAFGANGADTWSGGSSTTANFSDAANWTSGSVNKPPISLDSLVFGVAGTSGTSLTADQTAGISYAGITFNSGASAFTMGGANGITLTGNVANNGTSLETLNFPIAITAARSFTTTTGGGDITLIRSSNEFRCFREGATTAILTFTRCC